MLDGPWPAGPLAQRPKAGEIPGGERAALIVFLFLFWIILNGKMTLEIIVLGAAVSAALSWFARRVLGISPREDVYKRQRYDKLAFTYMGFICLASILIWIK